MASDPRKLARSRALVQLTRNHGERFLELYQALVDAEGLPPIAQRRERHKELNRLRGQARRDLASLEEYRSEFAELFQAELALVGLRPQPLRRTSTECGTLAGRRRHRRKGEEPCDPCKTAEATAQRDYRQAHAEDRAARKAAVNALTADNPDRFELLLKEERAKAGADGLKGKPRYAAMRNALRRARRRVEREWPEFGRYLAHERTRRQLP
jgi:hypothetical protein